MKSARRTGIFNAMEIAGNMVICQTNSSSYNISDDTLNGSLYYSFYRNIIQDITYVYFGLEGSCERGNDPSGSIKHWEVLEWLHN
jgi:hypothetical protein